MVKNDSLYCYYVIDKQQQKRKGKNKIKATTIHKLTTLADCVSGLWG
jgi:hypothetical protein